MRYYGRNEELNILENKYNSQKFEFGYLYGQRRIGKTSLIQMFRKNHKSIVLFASDSDDIKILESFSLQFHEQAGILNVGTYKDWDSFFDALSVYFGEENGIVVIDEYPNIVLSRDGKRKKTDFVTKLQKAIDYRYKYQKFVFLLTGSNITFMEKEIKDSKAPLYQRNTFQLKLFKFEWNESLAFLKNCDNYEKAKILALTSTYPLYLSLIDDSLTFDENLTNLFYKRSSTFIDDPSKLFTSNIAESGFYSAILDCISNGIDTIKNIAINLKAETGKVAKYLNELIEADIVSKNYVFMSKRETYYAINDPMLTFFYRFIRENIEYIKLGYGEQIKRKQEAAINDFIHHHFEKECIEYLRYLSKKGELNDLYLEFTNYKVEKSSLNRSVEIDIVSSTKDNLLVGECKLSKQKRATKDYYDLLEDTSIPPFASFKRKTYYLFSASGFEEKLDNVKDINLHLIDLKTMFDSF